MPPRTLFYPFRPYILNPSRSPFSNFSKSIPPNRPTLPTPSLRQASQFRRPQPRYNRFSRSQQLRDLWRTSPSFRYKLGAVGLGGGAFYVYNLERVPVSGRLRFNCIPASFEEQMGQQLYQQVMREYGGKVLPASHPESRMVRRVLERLVPHSGLEGQGGWEVRVIEDEQANAFVIPGGKVFVFSGILPICGGEDGLAAVLGHEIAHNVAHHQGEKMSQLYAIILPVALAISSYLDVSGQLVQLALDLVYTRPGSRSQESEADYIGLLMMAQSCYDPEAAIGLWQRMAKAEQYAPPQFLSTHPSSKSRISTIQNWLPEAVEKRNQSECGHTIQYADAFRTAVQQGSSERFW